MRSLPIRPAVVLLIGLATTGCGVSSLRASDTVSKPDARQHALALSESFSHFIKAVMATYGKLPVAYKEIAPPLTALSKVLTADEVDLEAYRQHAGALSEAISHGDDVLESLLEQDTGEGEGDHSVENIVGHWDNVKYHGKKLEWVGDLSDDSNSVRVGPITPAQQKVALSAVSTLGSRIAEFEKGIEAAPQDMMYRNLYLTQLRGMRGPLQAVKGALMSQPPWWTPEAFRALSELVRIHEVTRNQQKRLTSGLMRQDFAFSSALNELVRVIGPIEGQARQSGGAIQIVYEPPPGQ